MSKQSQVEAHKRYRQRNKGKYKEWRKDHYDRNREDILEKQKERRDSNLDTYHQRELTAMNKRRQNNYPKWLLIAVKQRSKRNNLEFNITAEDIIIPESCPILGIPIHIGGTNKENDNSPSIDRKNNDKGYVKGNVWIISNRANKLKSNGTLEEFRCLVEHWPTYANF